MRDQVILPTGNIKIARRRADAPDAENYKEFWYTMVGLAGEGQNFDGNGMYVRFQPGGGDQTRLASASAGAQQQPRCSRNAVATPLGTRPAFPGQRPPYKPDVPCYTQTAARTSTAPPTGPRDPAERGATTLPADRAHARRRRGGARRPPAGRQP